METRGKLREARLRRKYREVHGKVVDFITHTIDDGTLYFTVRFTDQNELLRPLSAEAQRGHSGKRQRKREALNDPTSSRPIACSGFLGLWEDAEAFDRAPAGYSPAQILAVS